MQTILTQCPRCQTSFKVSDKQLAIAGGMVRCGSCLDVFSAPDNRITIKQPVSAVPPPETFPDEHEDEGNGQQATPVAPLTPEDTDPYHQEASQLIESAALESESSGAATPPAPDPAMDIAATTAAADDNAPAASSDELEFILDYEDELPLGDMMLDDALAQDYLASDVLDAGIHDAHSVADANPYAGPESPGEATFQEELEEGRNEDAGFIHETGRQPASAVTEAEVANAAVDAATANWETAVSGTDAASNDEAAFSEVDGLSPQETINAPAETAESIQGPGHPTQAWEEQEEIIAFVAQEFPQEQDEQAPAVVEEFQPWDPDGSNYKPHTEQPAVEQEPDALILDDLADASEANIETTVAGEALSDDQQLSPETGTDDVQTEIAAAEPHEFFSHSPADDNGDGLNPEDAFTADNLAGSDDFHTPGFSALSSDEIEEIELSAPKPQAQRDKAELREYLAELEDADALEPLPSTTMDSIEEDPLTFEVRHVFRKYVTTFGWFALSLALLAALVLQVVASNLEFMQRSPSYSRYLPLFCKVLDCPEPERATAIQSLRSQDLLVRSHPSVPDALEVSFIFSNDANMPQAFPLVEMSFMDSDRQLMANRLFTPEEYLPPELAVLEEMPASSSVQVTMEMSDPGSDAVNYAITLRDPLTENPTGSTIP